MASSKAHAAFGLTLGLLAGAGGGALAGGAVTVFQVKQTEHEIRKAWPRAPIISARREDSASAIRARLARGTEP